MNRRITHFFYIVILSYMSLLVQAQVSPIVPGESLWCITQRIGETTDTILEKINSLLDCPCGTSFVSCLPQAIMQTTGTITLAIPGNYCLANNFAGTILITGECITLDLNNRCVMGIIAITANRVQLLNGTIIPPATESNNDPAAVSITGVQHVVLQQLTIDCSSGSVDPSIAYRVGLLIKSASDILLQECTSINGSNGFLVQATTKSTLSKCQANNNQAAGISLEQSEVINVVECEALANGSGSATSFGFISTNGTGNIFKNCIAESTTTNTADWESIAAGFALTGSEVCSIITNCISNNNGSTMPLQLQSDNIIASGTPYGILLQYNLVNGGSPVNNVTVPTDSGPFSVNWSPDGRYIAVVNTNSDTLQIFNAINPLALMLAGSAGTGSGPISVNWSPNGNFIAVVNISDNTLQIFDATNPLAPVLAGPSVPTNAAPISVNWSPDGNYVAVVNFSGNLLQLFNVTNPSAPILAGFVGTDNAPISVNWSPNGRYIAVVNNNVSGTLQIFNATNPSALVLAGPSVTTGNAPISVNWSPDGRYIAVVNNSGNSLQIFNATNPSAPVLVGSMTTDTEPFFVNWSPDGRYIALICGGSSAASPNILQIFNVINPTMPVLVSSVSTTIRPTSVNWSPDGRYIAVSISGLNSFLQLYNTLSFPTSNTIANNLVDCTSTPTTTYARGIGLSGSSGVNLIINNVVSNGPLDYAFVDNTLNSAFCDARNVCA